MTRQEKNETFLLTSFLDGGNAAYIEELYARFVKDPNSVDATWRGFFGKLGDAAADVSKNAEGPSWGRRDWPQAANGELVSETIAPTRSEWVSMRMPPGIFSASRYAFSCQGW